jgi:hypothetical protein
VNDFAFVLGSDRYECSRIVADFLSPRLGQAHAGGLPQDEFVIETEMTLDQFESFVSHCYTSFSGLREDERRVSISVAREFGNHEIYSLLAPGYAGLTRSILEL